MHLLRFFRASRHAVRTSSARLVQAHQSRTIAPIIAPTTATKQVSILIDNPRVGMDGAAQTEHSSSVMCYMGMLSVIQRGETRHRFGRLSASASGRQWRYRESRRLPDDSGNPVREPTSGSLSIRPLQSTPRTGQFTPHNANNSGEKPSTNQCTNGNVSGRKNCDS